MKNHNQFTADQLSASMEKPRRISLKVRTAQT
jgi:hypothetical protein